MDHQRIPQQAVYWQVPGYTRSIKSELVEDSQQRLAKDGGLPGKKQRWQLLTDMDGVGVWPYVSSWMRDEPKPRSRVL